MLIQIKTKVGESYVITMCGLRTTKKRMQLIQEGTYTTHTEFSVSGTALYPVLDADTGEVIGVSTVEGCRGG